MTREPRTFAVLAFESTHDALDAETLLADLGIDVVPIPAPKAIGARCGIALRIEPADEDRAMGYIEAAGIAVVATHSNRGCLAALMASRGDACRAVAVLRSLTPLRTVPSMSVTAVTSPMDVAAPDRYSCAAVLDSS